MNICKPTSIDANKIDSCDLQVLTAYQFELLSKRDFSGSCPTPPSKLPDDSVGCAVCFSNEMKSFLNSTLIRYNTLLLESETLNPLTTQKTKNLLNDIIQDAETLENETSIGFKNIVNHPFCKTYSEDLSSMESKGKKGLIASSDFFKGINTATIPGMKDEIDALIKSENSSAWSPSSNPTGTYAQGILKRELEAIKLRKENFMNTFESLPVDFQGELKSIKNSKNFIKTVDKKMALLYGECLSKKFSPSRFEAQLKNKGLTGNKASGKIYSKLLKDTDSIELIDKKLQTQYSFYNKNHMNTCKDELKSSHSFMTTDYKEMVTTYYSNVKNDFKKNIQNIFYDNCTFSVNSLGPNPTKPLCLKSLPSDINKLNTCKNYIQTQKEFIEKKMSMSKETLKVSLENYEKETNSKLYAISTKLKENVAILKARFGDQDKLVAGVESISIDTPVISFSSQALNDFDLRDAKSLLKSPSDFFKNDQGENLTNILMKKINDISGSMENLDKGLKEAQESVDQVYNVVLAKMQSCQSSSENKKVACEDLAASDQNIKCTPDNLLLQKVQSYCSMSKGTIPNFFQTACNSTDITKKYPCQISKYLEQQCHIIAEGTNASTNDASIGALGQTYPTSSTTSAKTTKE